MRTQRGQDFLLKLEITPNTFTTVAGLRTNGLSLNSASIDVTHQESPGAWRELMGGGIKTASIRGTGVFRDAASDLRLHELFFQGEIGVFQIVLPDFLLLCGPFHLPSLEYQGQYDGEMTFSLELSSAGALEATPL